MGTIPDRDTVRAYLRVPTTALSDDDLDRMLATAESDQFARCTWPGLSRDALAGTVADMTATVTVWGGRPGRTYLVAWDATSQNVVTADAAGKATDTHTYDTPGDMAVWVRDDTTGATLGALEFTVPGDVVVVSVEYPDALAQALLRRVQREVAARNLPLGMVGVDAAEYGPTRLPYLDALVEEHERAYRRVVLA